MTFGMLPGETAPTFEFIFPKKPVSRGDMND